MMFPEEYERVFRIQDVWFHECPTCKAIIDQDKRLQHSQWHLILDELFAKIL